MIIKKLTAKRLIKAEKAKESGKVFNDGYTYMAIIRYDLQRIDHYLLGEGDLRDD
jgi:hypothetical protein